MKVDADIEALVKAERLTDAAGIASCRGQAALASELYERACAFAAAATQAFAAGDHERALMLAAIAEDDAIAERALGAIKSDNVRARVAHELGRRGHHGWSARVLETIGRAAEAANAWSRAGRADRAADLLERLGEPVAAARELESALKVDPERHGFRLQLGRLLLRHGRSEAGVHVLQAIPRDAPERAHALVDLGRAFEALGLPLASAEAKEELGALDVSAPVTRRPSERPRQGEGPVRAQLFGRYEVVAEVASTASARVIECVDVLTAERVALKVFAGSGLHGVGRDVLARFEREVAILRSLRHPNVVPLRAYLPEGPALALAWMSGGTLAAMLERDLLAPARAVEIAAAILDALAAAHRAGVIHRDVKPSNVLFDGAGAARLSDFGAAHLGDLAATATAGVIGTFAYMSPEQREGRAASIVSDVYSVGVMLREMLTGRPPNDDAGVQPSAVHRDLAVAHDEVVTKLTALEPENRPRDAASARQLLLALAWPSTCEPVARREVTLRPARALEHRLEELLDPHEVSLFRDRWTGRRLRLVPLNDRTLARARAFARAHGQTGGVDLVLRVDTRKAELWVEELDGRALDRALDKVEARALERALAALHEEGIAYGHVDREHIRVSSRFGPRFRFVADAAPTATPDLDRLALAAILRDSA